LDPAALNDQQILHLQSILRRKFLEDNVDILTEAGFYCNLCRITLISPGIAHGTKVRTHG
jgi:hypothetical protein